jgi:DHA2 family metal-tetracycline-proton antiporter-like MFS transporter
MVVLTSFLLIFGRVGDYVGYKKIFILGLITFASGSYLCAVSLNFYHLLLFRIIQGLGSSMLLSVMPAIITLSFNPENRGKAFGYISLATTMGLASGYGLGGLLVAYANWRWIFLVTIPLAILAIVIGIKFIPMRQKIKRPSSFDLVGAFLIFITLTGFLLVIEWVRLAGWNYLFFVGGLFTTILAGIIFILWELKEKEPLFDLRLLKNIPLALALSGTFLANLVLTGTIFLVPFYLELVKGYSADFAGMIILIPSVLILITGPLAGHLSDNFGSKPVTVFSGFALVISTFIFAMIDVTVGIVFIFVALATRSLCEGMYGPANNKLVMSHTSSGKTGSISSLLNTSRYLGVVMGVVVFQGIFDSVISTQVVIVDIMHVSGAYHLQVPQAALITGFQGAFFAGMVLSILIIVVSFLTNENKDKMD